MKNWIIKLFGRLFPAKEALGKDLAKIMRKKSFQVCAITGMPRMKLPGLPFTV